ncbi:molybdenum cofactor biosynthesis protein MoaE [Salinibacterium sp. UTAS2018]|uniref:molybdenum cofactor biosynthesis protein MoaE n=1 Tax=unclassified Salinibacterium TaxID=2632331 RepID=UPI0010095AE8|nr:MULTISPECIES: molybdenum cofactor biosynthesis protein MoaE [unclassified Salinibacterium]MBH0008386.1 molybdenum cofactor biosynthesis protein MoaE [Salinibacterium sp. SWN1162]QAV70303.1 molybdenum cofactor biosynthesis protein MoaE [Salinibacterium sp. UTAS2018]
MNDQTPASFALISDAAIDEAAIRRAVESPASGAVVVFSGVVRNHDGGNEVWSLEYQAHPEAEALLARCCAEVAAETGLAIAAAHRVGLLQIGDIALSAAVSAAHRREAFEACELLVERIKKTVPIWKRQQLAGGATEWVGL